MRIRPGDVLVVDEPKAGQDCEGIEMIRAGFGAVCMGPGSSG